MHFRSDLNRFSGLFVCLFLLFVAVAFSGCAGYVAPSTTKLQSSISVTPSSLNFNTVVVGQTITQTIHVTNTGKSAVQISSLSVSDKDFVISGPSIPRSILPGATLLYTLAFTPSTPGAHSGSLNIGTNSSAVHTTVALAGSGEKVTAAVALNPPSINFGNLVLQTTSTKTVILQNVGDVNVKISGVTVAGAGFGYADLSPGFSLSPNQQITFQVWFKPTVKGAAAGTVSIISANLSSPATLDISGDGVTSTSPTPPPTPPPTPTPHAVHLTWSPSSTSAVSYRIYRGTTSGGPYPKIISSSVNGLSYDDSAVTDGTTYYYVVTSVEANGSESTYSNQAAADVPSN